MIILRTAIVIALSILASCAFAEKSGVSSSAGFIHPSPENRSFVLISDLHVGLGKRSDDSWHEVEDFRWPRAFGSFLREISKNGGDRVDLIIIGDFLELWQAPEHISCRGVSPDLGCTIPEMKELVSLVIRAHEDVFRNLKEFSLRGDNRVHILPGNHDSALLLPEVWELVAQALEARNGRVNLVPSGIWASPDGKIVVEHGHQIGREVNRYEDWPNIVSLFEGKAYIVRPWGERFVQKMFNEQERAYPVIDNLAPESAGARYRMEDRGLWGSAVDLADFLAFNLFQTSLTQMNQMLGGGTPESAEQGKRKWDVPQARSFGHRLFAAALPRTDPFRTMLAEDVEQAKALRAALDRLALDESRLPDENVLMLCDQASFHGEPLCADPTLGAMIQKIFVDRERVLLGHLLGRQKSYPKMRYFIYGHTHLLEDQWQPSEISFVEVFNTGAFHRVVNEAGFLKRVKDKNISPAQGLRKLQPEELPPCYTALLIPYQNGVASPRLMRWFMREEDKEGRFVMPGDACCN